MDEPFIVLGIIGAIWALFLFLRAPAWALFLSLLVGQLLASQTAAQVYSWITPFFEIKDFRYLQLTMLLLPVVLTLVILRGRVSKPKLSVEAITYLLVAASCVVLAVDYSWLLQQKVESAENQFGDYKAVIIIAASLTSLLSAWINAPSHHKKHGKHHK
jgi:hypothetical protein